ncbi:TolC family protein [bacterium]|nr:TolC family protein [bacterium]
MPDMYHTLIPTKIQRDIVFLFILLITIYQGAFASANPDMIYKDLSSEQKTGIQDAKSISLADLLRLALEKSSTMEINELNKQIASTDRITSQESFQPAITTSMDVNRKITPSSSSGLSEVRQILNVLGVETAAEPYLNFVAADSQVLSAAWNKMDRNGISYSIGYSKIKSQMQTGDMENGSSDFGGWSKTDPPVYIDSFSAAVSIPIFRDWGDVNVLPERYAEVTINQAEIQSEIAKLNLIKSISNAYWDLVVSHENMKMLEEAAHLAEQLLKETRLRYDLGTTNPIEIRHSESHLATTRLALQQEITNKSHIENTIRTALQVEDQPLCYYPSEKPHIRDKLIDFESLFSLILKRNRELALMNSELQLNQFAMEEIANLEKPDIDLNLQYNINGFSRESSFASDRMAENRLNDYQLGLTWRIPLFDRSTPEKKKKILLENSRLTIQINTIKLQLKTGLQSILINIDLAKKAIGLASDNRLLMESLLKEEMVKYKVGESTGFQLAQVQQELIEAKKHEILARVQYEKLYLELLILTEKIYDEYHLNNLG